eukprot:TRINITY_DN13842_c0_g1_i1.p1 TRINITY_DN13842_c0_g1~~TRINITY_DN13842_c0_g1_i1.p1  ORF type:complete len:153 (+),score=52.05 TRINITY_DN13842_c0_g1_i1:99-557(+)
MMESADELAMRAQAMVTAKCKEISDDQERVRRKAIEKGCETAEEKCGGYSWQQSKDDVTINVEVPPGTKARAMHVVIGATKVSVALRSGDSLLEGTLAHAVLPDDSLWTVDGTTVSLQLVKAGGPTGGGPRWKQLWAEGGAPQPVKADAEKP